MESNPDAWTVDELDPRAPTREQWSAMSETERAHVVATLPVSPHIEGTPPGEGDAHYAAVQRAHETLKRFFKGHRASDVYIGVNKAVYYPAERVFVPDVMVVVGTEPHPRYSWNVLKEDKGLDVVIEFLDRGAPSKDMERNPELYARLGISEYFLLDIKRRSLYGWRLPDGEARYQRLVPQEGVFVSKALGIELGLVDGGLQFYYLGAALPDSSDVVARLSAAVSSATRALQEESRRAEEESRRAEEESRRAEEESRRAEELAARVAALEATLAERDSNAD